MQLKSLALLLLCLGSSCQKPSAPAASSNPQVVSSQPLWPTNGVSLMTYEVTKQTYPAKGPPLRFERAKTIESDQTQHAIVRTTDDYKPTMTEYFCQQGDEILWTGFQTQLQKKSEINTPLVVFKSSFQGGEQAGGPNALTMTVVGWEEVELPQNTLRCCRIQISLMVDKRDTFSGFRRTLWWHPTWGPVKEEKTLYKQGIMVEQEQAILQLLEPMIDAS